jgi:hypothetical protein
MSNQRKALGVWTKTSWLLLAGCWLLLLPGCVYRSLTIKTEPPGALVYVNDQLKGESPVTYDFMWYGWYRVTIRKEGFERIDDRKLMRAPVYLWIPLDLCLELLPFPIRDTRIWSYTLSRAPELPTPKPPIVPPAAQAPVPRPSVTTTPPQPEERDGQAR